MQGFLSKVNMYSADQATPLPRNLKVRMYVHISPLDPVLNSAHTLLPFVPHRKHNTSPFYSQELRPLEHRGGPKPCKIRCSQMYAQCNDSIAFTLGKVGSESDNLNVRLLTAFSVESDGDLTIDSTRSASFNIIVPTKISSLINMFPDWLQCELL
jgi:hypothetical protein